MGNETSKISCKLSSYNEKDTWGKFNPNWMNQIPDDIPISNLTIPGTHNTCANTFHLFGFGYVRCQSLPLLTQLEAGIRFLDIRCRHIDGYFTIHHEMFYLEKYFTQVLEECIEFLNKNPSECIIMTIREEYKPKNNNSKTFLETFKYYHNLFFDYIYLSKNIPNIGKIRKKIWILQGDNVNLSTFAFKASKLENNWKVSNETEIKNKVERVRSNLINANKSNSLELFITMCSASGFGWNPVQVCKNTNKIVFEFIKGKLGIVVFDFPSEEVVEHLINLNLK